MRTILELLNSKSDSTVHTIAPENTLFEAVTLMVDKLIGAVLVVEDDTIKGIVTERDYLRYMAADNGDAKTTPVHKLMTRKVIYVTPETSLDSVMAIMTSARIRHIPVLIEGKLSGIVSIGDLVKQISQNQEIHINTLEDYINDSYPGPASNNA